MKTEKRIEVSSGFRDIFCERVSVKKVELTGGRYNQIPRCISCGVGPAGGPYFTWPCASCRKEAKAARLAELQS